MFFLAGCKRVIRVICLGGVGVCAYVGKCSDVDREIKLHKALIGRKALGWGLQVLRDPKKYGILEELKSMTQGLPAIQIESLELILRSMQSTLYESETPLCSL